MSTNAELYLNLADAVFSLKQDDRAERYYQRAILLNPKLFPAIFKVCKMCVLKIVCYVFETSKTCKICRSQWELYESVSHSSF